MQALTGQGLRSVSVATPLTRGARQLAAHIAPWPQRQAERAGGIVKMQARNRLADLLAEMKAEDVEDDTTTPIVTKLEWQSPLAVLMYPDPRLRAPNSRIGTFDDSLRKLAEEMFTVMYEDDGVGLAAPQVGVNVRLMVFNEAGKKGEGDEIVLVNPQIINLGKSRTLFEEGCLSFPNIYADVERPTKVKVKAQDLSGKKFTINLRPDRYVAALKQL